MNYNHIRITGQVLMNVIKKIVYAIACCLSLVLISNCGGIKKTDLINAMLSDESYQLTEMNYGMHARKQMSIYLPKHPSGKPPVFFIYGGTWRNGERHDYQFVAHALIELGFPVIIPDYRLFPEVRFPAFIDDIADAIAYTEQHSADVLGVPLTGYILLGHSAGAYNAALLAADNSYLQSRGVMAKPLALIGLAGPYDLPLDDPDVSPVFRSVTDAQTNPLGFAHGDMPATLLLHGLKDQTVGRYHVTRFKEVLNQLGVRVETRLYEDVDHIEIIGSLAAPLRFLNNSYQDIAGFLDRLTTKPLPQTGRIVTRQIQTD